MESGPRIMYNTYLYCIIYNTVLCIVIPWLAQYGYGNSSTALALSTLDASSVKSTAAIKLWHARLGHVSPKVIAQLSDGTTGCDDLKGVTERQAMDVGHSCLICPKSRMLAPPHPKASEDKPRERLGPRPTKFGDTVSTDIKGPLPVAITGDVYLHPFFDPQVQ